MDLALKIFIFLSLCVAQAKPKSQLTRIVIGRISVPESQLGRTTIVKAGVSISPNHPFMITVTAERNKTNCNATDSIRPFCPLTQLECRMSVETRKGNGRPQGYIFQLHPSPGSAIEGFHVGREVNRTSGDRRVHPEVAEIGLDFQYDPNVTSRGRLLMDGNATSFSFSFSFFTDVGEEDDDEGNGQPALYPGRFWAMIPLVLLPAFLLH